MIGSAPTQPGATMHLLRLGVLAQTLSTKGKAIYAA